MPAEPLGLRQHWGLDAGLAFLNHGSFGACPKPVLAHQAELRRLMERSPVDFFARQLETRLDAVRERLGAFVGADPDDLAFMPNATAGVNTFLRAFPLAPGDHVLVTDHAYPAARNAVEAIAAERGAQVTVARLPYPGTTVDGILESVLAALTPETRLAVLDHVTSASALVLPLPALVEALAARGIPTLVDGAHGPGMVPLSLSTLGAVAYAANCHKWMCTPKGAAFLWVERRFRERVRPLAIGLGASASHPTRDRFRLEHDWTGTADPTPLLCIPEALDFLGGLLPGGLSALMAHNRHVVHCERERLSARLGTALPCDEALLGSMATVELPDGGPPLAAAPHLPDPVHQALFERFAVEVPVHVFPSPRRFVRLSAQAYNTAADFERLQAGLLALFALR